MALRALRPLRQFRYVPYVAACVRLNGVDGDCRQLFQGYFILSQCRGLHCSSSGSLH